LSRLVSNLEQIQRNTFNGVAHVNTPCGWMSFRELGETCSDKSSICGDEPFEVEARGSRISRRELPVRDESSCPLKVFSMMLTAMSMLLPAQMH
jgi:hypothetical protein